jgi:hypothetical protein
LRAPLVSTLGLAPSLVSTLRPSGSLSASRPGAKPERAEMLKC